MDPKKSRNPIEPDPTQVSQTAPAKIDPSPIDAILASEEPLLPSSGFLAAVMERVEEESRPPAPLPFPWKRALPGIVLVAAVFGSGAVELVRLAIPALQQARHALPTLPAALPQAIAAVPPAILQPLQSAAWVALALGLSLASWLLSRRLQRF